MAIIEGFLFGLGMLVFLGPVFFTLLKSTLQQGFLAGFMVALGIFVSDIVCVGLCYWGASAFLQDADTEFWISILGSFILFSIGLKYLIKPSLTNTTEIQKDKSVGKYEAFNFFTKGFLVNFVNPFVFGVWLAVIGYAQNKYSSETSIFYFLAAALLAILLTDSLKVVLAQKIKPFIKEKVLLKVYRGIGLILVLFGIRLLVHVF